MSEHASGKEVVIGHGADRWLLGNELASTKWMRRSILTGFGSLAAMYGGAALGWATVATVGAIALPISAGVGLVSALANSYRRLKK